MSTGSASERAAVILATYVLRAYSISRAGGKQVRIVPTCSATIVVSLSQAQLKSTCETGGESTESGLLVKGVEHETVYKHGGR